MRFLLGSIDAKVLSAIHVSDEPADVLRELELFSAHIDLDGAFDAIETGADGFAAAQDLILKLGNANAARDWSQAAARERLMVRLGSLAWRPESAKLMASVETLGANWRETMHGCLNCGYELEFWDIVCTFAPSCENFVGGDSYSTTSLPFPDDKCDSWPLDEHLLATLKVTRGAST
jgi:hypothetical protein